MSLKDRVKGMRVVHDCWAAPEDEVLARDGREYCRRVGCPYADVEDCTVDAIVEATALVEELWRVRKELKKRVERGPVR